MLWGVAGLAGCATDEPEDGTTTVASSVGGSGGGETGAEESTSGSSDASSSTGPATGSSTGVPAVVYEDDIQPIWNASCTCHLMGPSGDMTAPLLTLNPGMSHAQLVGVAAEQAELARVEPNAPEESYLWLKLNDIHTEVGEGTVMPQGGMLDDGQLELVDAWIRGGAVP